MADATTLGDLAAWAPAARGNGQAWSRDELPDWFAHLLTDDQLTLTARSLWIKALTVPGAPLTASQQHVALLLTRWMGVDGRCNPSIDAIAAATPLARRTIIAAIGGLVDSGWLYSERGRGRRSSRYRARVPRSDPRRAGPPGRVAPQRRVRHDQSTP